MQQTADSNEPSYPRVLVIDSEENVSEYIRLCLQYEGYRVESCPRGLEGEERIQHNAPDLVILDLALPDIGGLELCQRIRIEKTKQELPIVIMTELKDPQIRLQALEAGANTLLAKPFDFDTLVEHIRLLVPSSPSQPPLEQWLRNHIW